MVESICHPAREQLPGGGELLIRGMDEDDRIEIGRKTLRFVRRALRDPEVREKVRVRAEQLQAEAAG